jgi:uncharacterized membrane protein YkvA (DUF1232 family)
MENTKLYSEMLEEIFSGYKGEYQNILRKIPIYFNALQELYSSEELTWEAKFKINSCFSYFAIPVDLIPDENPEGYIDDLFVCVYVLHELFPEYSHIIKSMDIEISEINQVLVEVEEILGNVQFEILTFTGLTRFKEMSERMNFLRAPSNIDEKTERIKDEILSLIGLLRTIFVVEGKKPKGRNLRDIKQLFDETEWNHVLMILENLEIHESGFDNSHEKELEKIKRKILLEVDEELLNE